MGDFFGRLGPDKKYFSTFFWFQPLGDPFWDPLLDPFWTPFGPILDTLDHFGPFWTHFGPFWSLWVTLEAINRSQMASAMGGLSGAPPLKNTILGRSRAPRLPSRRIPEKSAGFPPGGWSSGGKFPLFSENRRQHGMAARDLTEKLVKTGGTPFLSTFWPFWAKVAQTGEFLEPPWSASY